MKRLPKIAAIIALHINSVAMASCDFATGIERTNAGYIYSSSCHQEVGQIVSEVKDRRTQVQLLNDAIILKEQAIEAERARAELWRKTSFEVEDRLRTIENNRHDRDFLYLGAGVLLTIGAAWAMGAASK